jgi:hypothetical protein
MCRFSLLATPDGLGVTLLGIAVDHDGGAISMGSSEVIGRLKSYLENIFRGAPGIIAGARPPISVEEYLAKQ